MKFSIKFFTTRASRFLGSKGAESLLLILIIILASSASFGLGVLSEREKQGGEIRLLTQEAASGLSLEEIEDGNTVVVPERDPGGYVVASKSGTKYHFPWCAGAQQMKEENKIWFNSIEEARAAGYTPAGNCKGLE